MSLASVEGVVITLVLVLPGALGIQLRSYLWSSRDGNTAEVLLSSVAFSLTTLLLLEFGAALVGLIPTLDIGFGSLLLQDILGDDKVVRPDSDLWLRYLVFATAAISLPSALRWIRMKPWLLKMKRTAHLSLESVGFEALFEESIKEAGRWDVDWKGYGEEGLHVMVDTEDDRRFQGEMMWRSTSPDPPELILINVRDITDAENILNLDGLVLIRKDNMRRIWVLKPPAGSGASSGSS
jgi:hypothetical protein